MSAPPSGRPNGVPRPHKPNPLRPMRRPPRPANPLVAPSRGLAPKPGKNQPPAPSRSKALGGPKPSLEELRKQNSGWSEAPPTQNYTDIPLVATKRSLLDGVRYHLMKFAQSKLNDKPVDPTDQEAFARPVTLHRRDARQPPPGRAMKEEKIEAPEKDGKELERLAQVKAERDAQRALDQAKIAPVAKDNAPKRPKKQKEDKTLFSRAPRSAAAKKESDIRYEEALPWHLEDADGRNVWVGNYVAALSEANVALMVDKAVFRLVPLEKWYRFTAKPPFQPFTIDQAEAFMNKKMDVGRWVMKDEERKAGQSDLEATRRLFYGHGQMVKTESDTFKAASRSEKLEHDELDVSEDEFQDDDETPHFERNDDEDSKISKERIRREQLGANLFGDGDEQEVDKELKEQLKEELERKKYGKKTKKALIKRDREDIYESDHSVEKPWSSSSDDDSSDEDDGRAKDEEKKDADVSSAQPEAKGKVKLVEPMDATISQEKLVRGDIAKKSKSLKRAGSPALSDSSGAESTRKKLKKTVTSIPGSRTGTPVPPSNLQRPRKNRGVGSGSDGEATAGEMSDGAGPRVKVRVAEASRKGSPAASRANSPSPPLGSTSPKSPNPPTGGVIEPWEILEKIPPDGIAIGDLIKPFHGRVGVRPGQMLKADWIKLVKQLCDYGPDRRLRRRK